MPAVRLAVHVPSDALDCFVGKSPKVKGKGFLFTCKRSIHGLKIILFSRKEHYSFSKAVEGIPKRVGRRHYKLVPLRIVPLLELSSMELTEVR